MDKKAHYESMRKAFERLKNSEPAKFSVTSKTMQDIFHAFTYYHHYGYDPEKSDMREPVERQATNAAQEALLDKSWKETQSIINNMMGKL